MNNRHYISNFFNHLHTVMHHKKLVMIHCFKVGLYRQGLFHDMSKFSFTEFWPGVKYYQGTRSPNEGERRDIGYSAAWLHHKGRNKHHMEYWTDYSIKGSGDIEGVKMPVKYIVEMFCDRVAASKTYKGKSYRNSDPYDYYISSRKHYIMNSDSMMLLETMLKILCDNGEEAAFDYIRKNILKNK